MKICLHFPQTFQVKKIKIVGVIFDEFEQIFVCVCVFNFIFCRFRRKFVLAGSNENSAKPTTGKPGIESDTKTANRSFTKTTANQSNHRSKLPAARQKNRFITTD
jgi:hypothetical protein